MNAKNFSSSSFVLFESNASFCALLLELDEGFAARTIAAVRSLPSDREGDLISRVRRSRKQRSNSDIGLPGL
jgi:hypothetical protein